MTDSRTLLDEARKELARFPAVLDALVSGLTAGRWRARPASGEWAPVEIVCHLRDEEAEDFGARVRVVLEGGTRFASIDPEGWARDRRYLEADPAEALAAFRAHRAASLAVLAGASPERLTAAGESPSGLRLTGLDVLAAWVAHDGLHLRQLAGTLTREWADRWTPLQVDYAGPLPYPRPGERGA
jgi:hypothetical protein